MNRAGFSMLNTWYSLTGNPSLLKTKEIHSLELANQR